MGARREQAIGNWAALGPAVRDARARAGLTQAALAEQAGVSRGWLIRFEAGLPNAEPVTVLRVLRPLGLELTLRARAGLGESAQGTRTAHSVDLDALLADLDAPALGGAQEQDS